MALQDLKFTAEEFAGNDVSSLPDSPSSAGMSASSLKAAFDYVPKVMVALGKHNGLVDALESVTDGASGADNIGATAVTVGGAQTVQGVLEALQSAQGTHTARVDNPHSVTKAQVGLGNADNTADANKPVSVAVQAALDAKAPTASPVFTGTATVPALTDTSGNNEAANKKYVDDKDALSVKKADITTAQTMGTATDKVPSEYTVTQAMANAGYGDMLKSVYDPNNDGKIDYLDATADGNSGADNVGATPLFSGGASTVQGVLNELGAYGNDIQTTKETNIGYAPQYSLRGKTIILNFPTFLNGGMAAGTTFKIATISVAAHRPLSLITCFGVSSTGKLFIMYINTSGEISINPIQTLVVNEWINLNAVWAI